jgi:hypothetical protein
MTQQEPKRRRSFADDALGGLMTFLIELGVVAVLALAALAVSALVLLLV